MAYNIQNYWVSGLCPSIGILNTRKHNISEIVFILGWGEEDTYSAGSVERTGLVIEVKGPNRVDAFLLSPKDGNRSSFQTVVA
jgi:hypothetical protein